MEGLAAGAAGLHGLWGKMGVIYRDKPTNFTNLGLYKSLCFVLSHEFSPDGELLELLYP